MRCCRLPLIESTFMSRPIKALISSTALQHNLGVVRRCAPRSRIFAVIKATLIDPWPYDGAERIVTIRANYPDAGRQGFA